MTEYTMPTEKEHEIALAKAKDFRNKGNDPFYINKTLISHEIRIRLLEHVLEAAGHYLHSGQAPQEHQILLKAIKKAREAEYYPGCPMNPDDELHV